MRIRERVDAHASAELLVALVLGLAWVAFAFWLASEIIGYAYWLGR